MYKLTQNHISTTSGEQTTILDHQAGIYYGLNEVGTFIWEILRKQPADFDTLQAMIVEKFAVDEQVCAQDLKEILEDLMNAELVEKI